MPKMKTNRAAAKRFRKTATGKIRCDKPLHGHILTKKSRKRKRRLGLDAAVKSTEIRRIKAALPYGL